MRRGEVACIAQGWRSAVDYILINSPMFDCLNCFMVVTRPESDHFPIIVEIDTGQAVISAGDDDSIMDINIDNNKYIWKKENKQLCLDIYNSRNMDRELDNLTEKADSNSSLLNVNDIVQRFSKVIATCCKPMLNTFRKDKNKKKQPCWFDKECWDEKK